MRDTSKLLGIFARMKLLAITLICVFGAELIWKRDSVAFEIWAVIIISLVLVACQHLVITFLRQDIDAWRSRLRGAIPGCKHPKEKIEYRVCQVCGAWTLDDKKTGD